jgi:hypothetical protein
MVLECIPFEKGSVKCVINEFLKVLQGNLGCEGRAPQVLEKAIEAVGPENGNVVFVGYIAQGGWNGNGWMKTWSP